MARISDNLHILLGDCYHSTFLQPATLWWPYLVKTTVMFTFGDSTHKRWYYSAMILNILAIGSMLFIHPSPITYLSIEITQWRYGMSLWLVQKWSGRQRHYHKLHSAITPRILAWFPRSRMHRKALKKTFWTMSKTCQSNQYSLIYQLISAGHWLADILGTAKCRRLLPCAHGSFLQYTSDDYK